MKLYMAGLQQNLLIMNEVYRAGLQQNLLIMTTAIVTLTTDRVNAIIRNTCEN